MIITTDDVCPQNLKYWKYWLRVKERHTYLKITAFVIANYKEQDVSKSKEFKEWFEGNKDWVEVQPHGLTHERPQLGWRDCDEQKRDIEKSIEILKPYLSNRIIYRFPGFRTLCFSETILKELKIDGVAHRGFIKFFKTDQIVRTLDTHCVESSLENSIGQIWQNLILKI